MAMAVTSQIARSYTRSHRDRKGLERRNRFVLGFLTGHFLKVGCCRIGQQTEHLANHPELHATRLPRKPQSTRHQYTY
jgi:hypothetical protein